MTGKREDESRRRRLLQAEARRIAGHLAVPNP